MSTNTGCHSGKRNGTRKRIKLNGRGSSTRGDGVDSVETGSHSGEPETGTGPESESKSPEEACLRNWLDLPREVTASILLKLGAIEIIESAQKVCTQWRSICKGPSMWRSIDMRNLWDLFDSPYLEKMCMHAVDRSCGGLEDINIVFFGTDDLLSYIANRTSNFKGLRLIKCWDVGDKGLSEAASKFPLLEELEIYWCIHVGKDGIEAVGKFCPLLKTFKYNQPGVRELSYQDDEVALAIGETMHGLRHLQLIGNGLTNKGLQAILDGCPYLESLDLRKCLHVNLEGDMGKKCAELIKNFRRPDDSTSDFEFAEEMNGTDGYHSSDLSDDDSRDCYFVNRYCHDYDDFHGYGSDSKYNALFRNYW